MGGISIPPRNPILPKKGLFGPKWSPLTPRTGRYRIPRPIILYIFELAMSRRTISDKKNFLNKNFENFRFFDLEFRFSKISKFENFCRHEMRVGQGYNIANYRFALSGLHKNLFTKNRQAARLKDRL